MNRLCGGKKLPVLARFKPLDPVESSWGVNGGSSLPIRSVFKVVVLFSIAKDSALDFGSSGEALKISNRPHGSAFV